MSISAFIPVFNEEKRIKYALTSLQWCDEIILLDKSSTDNTVEIARKFGAKVFVMPNLEAYDVSEFDYFNYCSSEWIIMFTASDIIDTGLVIEILRLTQKSNFEYDIIEVPYKRYILGLENKRSPWYGKSHPSVFRKSVLKINKNEVHGAIIFESNRIFTIKEFKNTAIHHLTHETVDSMMDRHIRYWRAEGNNFNYPNMKNAFRDILRALKIMFWNRKTYLLGWQGIVLMCAYMSYILMSFVYKWEKLSNGYANKEYERIRIKSLESWSDFKQNCK